MAGLLEASSMYESYDIHTCIMLVHNTVGLGYKEQAYFLAFFLLTIYVML